MIRRSDKILKEFLALSAQVFVAFAVKKKTNKNIYCILIIIIHTVCIYSQSENISDIISNTAEELSSDESDPEAASAYIEKLHELTESPVKINSASETEISRLFFLSDFQVKAIADYVRTSGKIVSVFEIANIPGFDRETVEMMIPLISLQSKYEQETDSSKWRHIFLSNMSLRSGENDSGALGGPWRVLSKYKITKGSLTGGLTAEKDPGEKLLTGTPPLPDFFSAHMEYAGHGIVRHVIAGDFSARFGQGTNVNTGISTGLSLTIPGYLSARNEIRPYTSTDENNFFRGLAAELIFNNLGLTIFYSRKNIDATLVQASDSTAGSIQNFYSAGLHNTPSSLLKKDAVSESCEGINLSYNFRHLKAGFTWSGDQFALPVKSGGNDTQDYYKFNGYAKNIYSVYYNGLIGKILYFGEISASASHSIAFVQGVSFRPSDRMTINYIFRDYTHGYSSFHGRAPVSSSSTGNDRELLGNFTFEAAKHLFISGGCDIRNFPWLKYRNSGPSSAVRKELRIRFLPTDKLTIETLYSFRMTMADKKENSGIPQQVSTTIRSLKFTTKYTLTERISFGSTLAVNAVSETGNRGGALIQDLYFRLKKVPLRFWLRYCIFKTDDWDTRIYAFENDILHSFSIPALYGQGNRSYAMAELKTGRRAVIRVKYGFTSLSAKGQEPDYRSEFKLQFRIWF